MATTAAPAAPTTAVATAAPALPIAVLPGVHKPSLRPNSSFGICIYGRSGTGKTTLVGSMPGRGLIIDVPQAEGGTFVLSDKADRIDVKEIHTWQEIQEVFWFLKKENHDYKWVAIDSLTAMTELAKRQIIKDRELAADPAKITLPEWGQLNQLTIELVYQFRTLPIHVIFVAQESVHDTDDKSIPAQIGPDTRTKVVNSLIPSMLLVGRTSVETKFDGTYEYRFRIGPHPTFMTKVRHKPGLEVPNVLRNADLGLLLRYLFGLPNATPPEAVDEMAVFDILTPA